MLATADIPTDGARKRRRGGGGRRSSGCGVGRGRKGGNGDGRSVEWGWGAEKAFFFKIIRILAYFEFIKARVRGKIEQICLQRCFLLS